MILTEAFQVDAVGWFPGASVVDCIVSAGQIRDIPRSFGHRLHYCRYPIATIGLLQGTPWNTLILWVDLGLPPLN